MRGAFSLPLSEAVEAFLVLAETAPTDVIAVETLRIAEIVESTMRSGASPSMLAREVFHKPSAGVMSRATKEDGVPNYLKSSFCEQIDVESERWTTSQRLAAVKILSRAIQILCPGVEVGADPLPAREVFKTPSAGGESRESLEWACLQRDGRVDFAAALPAQCDLGELWVDSRVAKALLGMDRDHYSTLSHFLISRMPELERRNWTGRPLLLAKN
jgi:hypothetical protein